MSEKEDKEYVVEAMGLHAAKLWTSVKPYQVKAICEALAKSESNTVEAVAKEAARWREAVTRERPCFFTTEGLKDSDKALAVRSQLRREILDAIYDPTSPDWLSKHDAEVVRPWREASELYRGGVHSVYGGPSPLLDKYQHPLDALLSSDPSERK